MITLSLALRDIVKSGYHLFYAKNRSEKIKEMETLILGVTKITVTFFTFSLLYPARFYPARFSTEIQNRLILTGLAFCIHPVAAVEIIGTNACILGISEAVKFLRIDHQSWKKPLLQMVNEAKEQAKKEGYPLNTGWFHFHSLKTQNRLREIIETIRKKDFNEHQWNQSLKTARKAGRHFMSSFAFLGGAVLSGASFVAFRKEEQWIDQKMVDFSKWAAPRFV